MKLPIAFEERMRSLLGAEYNAFYEALCSEDDVKALRVNTHKLGVKDFCVAAPFDLSPLPYAADGFIISKSAQAGKHPYHHAGAYYMQDPGAMATVAALPASLWQRRDLRVLDVCAAPGGKTTQLAALCAPMGGAVLANEYVGSRSKILAGNVERMGLDNVCVTNVDSKYLAAWYPAFFDLVVVDAPCSGEGMYRKNELAVSEWSLENVAMCAARQAEILENAAVTVASGGYLLYSTCTYSVEENEATVAAFLSRHPEFCLRPVSPAVTACTADGIVCDPAVPSLALCRRFYPHRSAGEGQFIALLQRDEDTEYSARPVKDAAVQLAKAERTVAEDFLKETLGHTYPALYMCGSYVTHYPVHELLPLPPFGVVSAGAVIGEVRKGRMVPHHHFFTAYGTACKNRLILALDDTAVAQYLAGEEPDIDPALHGTVAVCLGAGDAVLSLGGGKAVGGKLKNHYPKGLRR